MPSKRSSRGAVLGQQCCLAALAKHAASCRTALQDSPATPGRSEQTDALASASPLPAQFQPAPSRIIADGVILGAGVRRGGGGRSARF